MKVPTVGARPAEPGSATGVVTRVLLAVIGFYRVAISPMRPPACRYEPSCSEYAIDALRTWGPSRGGWLAVRRLLRCHPWHAGGLDPVPSRARTTNSAPLTSVPSDSVPSLSSTAVPSAAV